MTIISKNEFHTNWILDWILDGKIEGELNFCEFMKFQKKCHNFMIFEKCQNCSMGFGFFSFFKCFVVSYFGIVP